MRAIAGFWADKSFVDYFPSYEIVTNPRMHSSGFSDNLRSVRDETVKVVMRHFFSEHGIFNKKLPNPLIANSSKNTLEDIQCEEELMEAFST